MEDSAATMEDSAATMESLKSMFTDIEHDVLEKAVKSTATMTDAIDFIIMWKRKPKEAPKVKTKGKISAASTKSDSASPAKRARTSGKDPGTATGSAKKASKQPLISATGVCEINKKKATNTWGYVGIVNQGATCYMNSLLQTLYFTNHLRKAVYKLPTSLDSPANSVALSLQRLFYDLQSGTEAVNTRQLTHSFGWRSWDSFLMHDVQELCRVLLDNLEKKMKDTVVDGTIKALFGGEMLSYTRCLNVDYQSSRTESFNDVQLPVKHIRNVEASFAQYIQVERLTGDNQYAAGQHGLQDAEKGVIFTKFPPVLHLQLMRFQYDAENDMNIKINDKYMFPEVLDLDRFLKETNPDNPAKYVLHTVLVHSGGGHKGHYVVYINPKADGKKWFKFDDDTVTACSKKEAIIENFGGIKYQDCGSAYMLVYIRQSQLGTILGEVRRSDIPNDLISRLQEERDKEVSEAKERAEAHLFMPIRVVMEDDLNLGFQGYDLFDRENFEHVSFKVRRAALLTEFVDTVAESKKCDVSDLRVWPMHVRECFVNGREVETLRATVVDLDEEDKENAKKVFDLSKKHYPWIVFIETKKDNTKGKGALKTLPNFDKENDVFLFFKRYDAKTRLLHYAGHMVVCKQKPLADLVPVLNERSGFPEGTALRLHEEVKPYQLDRIEKLDEPLETAVENIRTGDILVFEKDEEGETLNPIDKYYWYLADHVNVIFRKKNVYSDKGFNIELLRSTTYEQLTTAVAERVNAEPYHLQFYRCAKHGNPEAAALAVEYPERKDWTLCEALLEWKFGCIKPLFFEILDIPIYEKDLREKFTCIWYDPVFDKEVNINVYPFNKGDNCVSDILSECEKQIALPPGGTGKLRLLETSASYISKSWEAGCSFHCMHFNPATRRMRVEEIPADHLNLADNERLIPVTHYDPNSHQPYGRTFMFKLVDGEMFSQMKKRLQEKIEASDEDFEKIEFTEVVEQKPNPLPENDFVITARHFAEPEVDYTKPLYLDGKWRREALLTPYLRLEHSRTSATSRKRTCDGSIKIFN